MTSLAAVGRGLVGLDKFFGCPIGKVDKIVQLMVLGKPPPPPEWVRGCQRLTDLPRATAEVQPHRFPIPLIRDREIADRLRWIIENTTGRWSFNEDGFGFEETRAAFHYKLRWV